MCESVEGPGCDMQLNHYEAQCCALADPGECGGMDWVFLQMCGTVWKDARGRHMPPFTL